MEIKRKKINKWNCFISSVNVMKPESHWKIIVHAKKCKPVIVVNLLKCWTFWSTRIKKHMYLVSVLVNWFSFLFCNLFFDECWLSNRPNLVIGFQDTYQKPGISLISSLYMSWIFCSIKSGSYTIGVKPLIIPPTTKFVVGRSILVSPCPSIRPSVDKSYVVR